jgi:protein-tyrosine kinase
MKEIFETLDIAHHAPIGSLNGDHTHINGDSEGFAGPRVSQASFGGTAVADLATPRTTSPRPTLEMTWATRQELAKLTHRLFLNSSDTRVVAFSGVQADVGCSWIVARIAQLLAEADAGSVCIVDADLHDPVQHKYFDVGNGPGLSDALIDSQPINEFVKSFDGGLHLLSGGSALPKADPLFSFSALRLRMDELRDRFDFLLFDTPPMSESADAMVVARKADGLTMVVEANSTNREAALKAVKTASIANVHILGTVLNKRTFPIPEAIYKML